jgi:hypothetical protein
MLIDSKLPDVGTTIFKIDLKHSEVTSVARLKTAPLT